MPEIVSPDLIVSNTSRLLPRKLREPDAALAGTARNAAAAIPSALATRIIVRRDIPDASGEAELSRSSLSEPIPSAPISRKNNSAGRLCGTDPTQVAAYRQAGASA